MQDYVFICMYPYVKEVGEQGFILWADAGKWIIGYFVLFLKIELRKTILEFRVGKDIFRLWIVFPCSAAICVFTVFDTRCFFLEKKVKYYLCFLPVAVLSVNNDGPLSFCTLFIRIDSFLSIILKTGQLRVTYWIAFQTNMDFFSLEAVNNKG